MQNMLENMLVPPSKPFNNVHSIFLYFIYLFIYFIVQGNSVIGDR